jgi:uncharacterized cupin superfamily protein
MPEICNLGAVPEEYTDDPSFESQLKTKYLGALAGSERIYLNIDYVKPGAKSTKYHSHSLQEEFFLILCGRGSVRIEDRILPVKRGDFFAKPAGRAIAHQFMNDGEEVLEILDCGTNEKSDVIEYPDEDLLSIKEKGLVFRKSETLKNWSSDPHTMST